MLKDGKGTLASASFGSSRPRSEFKVQLTGPQLDTFVLKYNQVRLFSGLCDAHLDVW